MPRKKLTPRIDPDDIQKVNMTPLSTVQFKTGFINTFFQM